MVNLIHLKMNSMQMKRLILLLWRFLVIMIWLILLPWRLVLLLLVSVYRLFVLLSWQLKRRKHRKRLLQATRPVSPRYSPLLHKLSPEEYSQVKDLYRL